MISKVVLPSARQIRQTAPQFTEPLPLDTRDYREHHSALAEGERALVSGMTPEARVFSPGTPIVEEGQQLTKLYRVVSGWVVCRNSLLDGRTQVVSILVPGDTIGAKGLLTGSASDLIEAHVATRLQSISHARVLDLAAQDFKVAMWLLCYVNREHLRGDKRLTLLGQGNAIEKIAITLLDIYWRLKGAGLIGDGPVRVPLTQSLIGEYVGLTLSHVCRTLGILHERGGVDLRYGGIEIVDSDALRASAADLADFWADASLN
jgi:CRP/FNR family transcriptional regulator, anaerobic regulatory protein